MTCANSTKLMQGRNESVCASIVIPIYNLEKYIERCLESVLKISEKKIEILLIDDGSKDKSTVLCQKYVDKDSRLRLISKENGGVSSARNTGIENAHGKWITFVDGDDEIVPEVYEKAISFLISNPDIELLLCKRRQQNKVNSCQKTQDFYSLSSPELKILQTGILEMDNAEYKKYENLEIYSVCMKFYRTEILNQAHLRLDENIAIGEDRIFNYSYLQDIKSAYIFNAEGYIYYENPDSVMHSFKAQKGMQMLESVKVFYKIAEDREYEVAQYGIRQYVSALKLEFCHPQNPEPYFQRKKTAMELRNHALIQKCFENGKLSKLRIPVAVAAFLAKYKLFALCDLQWRIYYKKR